MRICQTKKKRHRIYSNPIYSFLSLSFSCDGPHLRRLVTRMQATKQAKVPITYRSWSKWCSESLQKQKLVHPSITPHEKNNEQTKQLSKSKGKYSNKQGKRTNQAPVFHQSWCRRMRTRAVLSLIAHKGLLSFCYDLESFWRINGVQDGFFSVYSFRHPTYIHTYNI